ncbi:MAG: hypothetical protein ACREAM_09135 [Blastocatellia bacterium]
MAYRLPKTTLQKPWPGPPPVTLIQTSLPVTPPDIDTVIGNA